MKKNNHKINYDKFISDGSGITITPCTHEESIDTQLEYKIKEYRDELGFDLDTWTLLKSHTTLEEKENLLELIQHKIKDKKPFTYKDYGFTKEEWKGIQKGEILL